MNKKEKLREELRLVRKRLQDDLKLALAKERLALRHVVGMQRDSARHAEALQQQGKAITLPQRRRFTLFLEECVEALRDCIHAMARAGMAQEEVDAMRPKRGRRE